MERRGENRKGGERKGRRELVTGLRRDIPPRIPFFNPRGLAAKRPEHALCLPG